MPISGETSPDPILVAAEGVEGHRDVRRVALAVLDQLPIVAEARNEADVVADPAVRDVAGFDEVDHGEQHQRFVRGDAAGLRTCGVEVGEFSEPMVAESLQVFRVQELRER